MPDNIEVKKYLFDLAFDDIVEGGPEREKPKPTFTQEQLEAAQKDGYEQGVSAGKKAVLESQQQYTNLLLGEINDKLLDLQKTSESVWQNQLAEMNQVALVIARKIMPRYVEANGLDEITAIVGKVIKDMSREPRLVIRVGEAQFDQTSEEINKIAQSKAYEGKVVILADDQLGPSDCRIEWADGGVERDVRTLWEEIDKILSADRIVVDEQPEHPINEPTDEAGA